MCPACLCFGIASTGPDEFRERGSIRLNDLDGPRTFLERPCSWLTSFRIINSTSCISWQLARLCLQLGLLMLISLVARHILGGAHLSPT